MDNSIKAWLYDILSSIHEIDSYFAGVPMDFKVYQNDLKTKRAVERNIEIIGEAMSRVLQADAGISLSNSRKIVDTRNRIIHGYDSVSDEIVWGIIVTHLPKLRNEIEQLIVEQFLGKSTVCLFTHAAVALGWCSVVPYMGQVDDQVAEKADGASGSDRAQDIFPRLFKRDQIVGNCPEENSGGDVP